MKAKTTGRSCHKVPSRMSFPVESESRSGASFVAVRMPTVCQTFRAREVGRSEGGARDARGLLIALYWKPIWTSGIGADLPAAEIVASAHAVLVGIGLVCTGNRTRAVRELQTLPRAIFAPVELWLGSRDAPAVATRIGSFRGVGVDIRARARRQLALPGENGNETEPVATDVRKRRTCSCGSSNGLPDLPSHPCAHVLHHASTRSWRAVSRELRGAP